MEVDDAIDGRNNHTPGTSPSAERSRLVPVPAPEARRTQALVSKQAVGDRVHQGGVLVRALHHSFGKFLLWVNLLQVDLCCPKKRNDGYPYKYFTESCKRKEVCSLVKVHSNFHFTTQAKKRRIVLDNTSQYTEKSTFKNASSRRLNACDGSKLVSSPKYCKAGKTSCGKPKRNVLPARDCDICCSEVGFCRDCCCILCSKVVDWAYEGYSSIRCEAKLDEAYVCGHVAHVECALRSSMVGTVGGSTDLIVEYYCRRCDSKTDLMPHVFKSLTVCKSLNFQDDVEKILDLCLCILRNSEQTKAKKLSSDIGLAISELKLGVPLGQIWNVEDNGKLAMADNCNDQNEIKMLRTAGRTRKISTIGCKSDSDLLHKVEEMDKTVQRFGYFSSDSSNVSAKLEDGIDKVLQELKRSHELEYRLAEEKLYYQKDFLLSLYGQFDIERQELANPPRVSYDDDFETRLSNIQHRVAQIKLEEEKLKQMMKVAHGFGWIPKNILEENFELIIDE